MRELPIQLQKLRKNWESGLTPLCVVGENDLPANPREVFVILAKPNAMEGNRYSCYRYLIVGDKWEISVDGQSVSLSAVWAWLQDPSALSIERVMRPEEFK